MVQLQHEAVGAVFPSFLFMHERDAGGCPPQLGPAFQKLLVLHTGPLWLLRGTLQTCQLRKARPRISFKIGININIFHYK